MFYSLFSAIKKLGQRGERFDIIFMDPPYAEGFYTPVLNEIKNSGILTEDGFIVAEAAKGYAFPTEKGFRIIKERKCGPAVMTFLNLEEERC